MSVCSPHTWKEGEVLIGKIIITILGALIEIVGEIFKEEGGGKQ